MFSRTDTTALRTMREPAMPSSRPSVPMICGMPGPITETTTIRITRSGKAHPGVDQALDDHVEPPAEIAGEDADQHRDHGGERRRGQPDDHRQLRAVQAARQHVAAEVVGAEGKLPGRRLEPVDRADLVEAVGRQEVGEDAAEQEQQEDDAGDGAQRLVAEQPSHQARGTCRSGVGRDRLARVSLRGRSRRRPSAVPHPRGRAGRSSGRPPG